MLVAVRVEAENVGVVLRRRITLLAGSLPRQPFHAASGMLLDEARRLVEAAEESARRSAHEELAAAQAELRAAGDEMAAVGAGIGGSPVTAPFEKLMTSHMLLHSSEGDMYRDAVADAAERLGLAVSRAPWREVWSQLGAELGLSSEAVRDIVGRVRALVGPPWSSDEKEACAAAWLAVVRRGH